VSAAVVVVGAGPAGLATARAYRQAGGAHQVTLLAADPDPPYRRPPLSKEFLRGEMDRSALPMEDSSFYAREGIELRPGVRVEELDLDAHVLRTDAGEAVPFGACVLATGSEPVRLPIPGGDDPGLLFMRTITDSERVAAAATPGARVLVIGSGFIGCEAAASVAMRGARVTLATDEVVPQDNRLGAEVGHEIARWLTEYGVALRLGAAVEAIERRGRAFEVTLAGTAAPVEVDAVLCAAGVRPRTELAEAAGVRIEEGAVATDEQMRCEAEGLWAVGDVAFARNGAARRPVRVEHWGDALAHGEVAGRSLAGKEAAWNELPGFWSTIGRRTLKYAAWGDGWDEVRVDRAGQAFTARYGREGTIVGVLTHGRDEDYENERGFIERETPLP
jgi:3-phenylpropionate/trans-cinnamate dioxygenase ferredoxin reductase subunit